jgi:hypothetical protein
MRETDSSEIALNWFGASTNRVRILLASSIAVRKSPTLKSKLIVALNAVPSFSQRKDKLDNEGKSSHPDGRHRADVGKGFGDPPNPVSPDHIKIWAGVQGISPA